MIVIMIEEYPTNVVLTVQCDLNLTAGSLHLYSETAGGPLQIPVLNGRRHVSLEFGQKQCPWVWRSLTTASAHYAFERIPKDHPPNRCTCLCDGITAVKEQKALPQGTCLPVILLKH
jgi:hypothetical protein